MALHLGHRRRILGLLLGAGLCCVATWARAGLRPLYGGELVVTVPAAPQTMVPSKAWNPAEVAVANAVGARLSTVTEGAPSISSDGEIRFTLRGDATWPDGSPLDAHSLAMVLRSSLNNAAVALPPFTFRSEGRELIVALPAPASDPLRYLEVPWLRLVHAGGGGPFVSHKGTIEADVNGLGGRAFADRLRVEVKEGRKLEPAPDGIALLQPGVDGRPVFALPRSGAPTHDVLVSALSGVDRVGLARLFVRTASHVPTGWPLPGAISDASTAAPVVLLVDASERDQKTVAERLQVLLRDRHITVRIAAENRADYFERLKNGGYDLALIALPAAPKAIQAATLLRLAGGAGSLAAFWKNALGLSDPKLEEDLLRETANRLGASLLYIEDGGIAHGGHVRDMTVTSPWNLDLGNAWLAPPGAP